MKKALIICGLPGTGKTTLSKMLAEKLNVEYLNDWGILKSKYNDRENRIELSKNCASVIDEYILNSHGGFVLDLDYSILPQEFVRLKSKDLCQIVYLGFDGLNEKQLSSVMKDKNVAYYLEISKYCKTECEKYKLEFYGINQNRQQVIADLLDKFC